MEKLDAKTIESLNNYFIQHLVPLKDNFDNYNFSVTGSIGAGKSTVLDALKYLFESNKFSVKLLPEYLEIDPIFGQTMLEKRIKNEISNTTFQNYIMDTYVRYMDKNKDIDAHICLIERLPDDSIMCFSNISNYDKVDLTDFDLYILFERMNKLVEKYKIPSYSDNESLFEIFTNTDLSFLIKSLIDLIENDIKNGVKNRIIGLEVSLPLSIYRIKERNRKGEDGYSKEYLSRIHNFYTKLYSFAKEDKRFLSHFTCIGNLVA